MKVDQTGDAGRVRRDAATRLTVTEPQGRKAGVKVDSPAPPDPDSEPCPAGPPVLRVAAMPGDANPYGDIFGGWLMAQMDMAAGLTASRYIRGRAVTVAVEAMTFLRPVQIGDEVSVFTEIAAVGRTSLRIDVQAWRRDRHGETAEKVTGAIFTFVAIGPDRRPRAIASSLEAPGAAAEPL